MKCASHRYSRLLIAALFAVSPMISWSAVPQRLNDFITQDNQLDLARIAKMDRNMRGPASIQVRHIIPLNMKATGDTQKVAAALLSHSLNSAFNSQSFKESRVGNSAGRIVTTGVGTDMNWVSADTGLTHKLKLKAKGTVASIKYKGLLHAKLSYEAIEGRLDFEVSKKLTGSTRLTFNHVDDDVARTDRLGFSWSW